MTSLALPVVMVAVLLVQAPHSLWPLPSRASVGVVWKFAVSVRGLFTVIAAVGLEEPAKHTVPLQDKLWNVNPELAVAMTLMVEPALTHSLDGLIVPPPVGETLAVRKYWC
jgi:hypothetical protein